MKKILLFVIMLVIFGCNKPKTVLICGDHVCINKAEAEQYFEDNLSLEVKIVNKKKKEKIDLVELNLKDNKKGEKKILIYDKDTTSQEIKVLTNKEKKERKAQLRERKSIKNKKLKKVKKNKQEIFEKAKNKKKIVKKILEEKKVVNKARAELVDICTILEKCSIDEISKYLIKQGSKKSFPDITVRGQ
jgi:hypothetical protein